ncbi:hypothetical protein IW262DRAFT_1280306, partial [Armillaria fumosa]
NVSTWWNLTFDMLKFAVDYKVAIRTLTGDQENGLRDLELSVSEWKVISELCDVLKVHVTVTVTVTRLRV